MIAALRTRAILTVVVLLALAGCGGGSAGEGFEVPHTIRFDGGAATGEGQAPLGTASVDTALQTPVAGLGKAKAAATIAADPVQVLRLVKVSETRISRLVYDYAFEPVVKTDSARADVSLRLVGAGVGTTITDAVSSAGSLPAAPELRLGDVVVLRVDRSKPFDTTALRWSVSSVVLPVGNTVTTQDFGWEFLEGEEGSTQRPIRVLAGGKRTTSMLLTPLRQTARPLSMLRWTIEDDAVGAFSVTGTELGPRLQVSAGAAPAGRTLTATLRGVDMATGTSIARPVAAAVLQPDGTATAAIGATGGSIATPLGVVEFLPNGLTETVGVTLVWKSAAGVGAQIDVRFDRDVGYAGMKFKLPALPKLGALPYVGASASVTPSAANQNGGPAAGMKTRQGDTSSGFCAGSTGGVWKSGLLSDALLEQNAYFVDPPILGAFGGSMRAKEGSQLSASNLTDGAKYTFAHDGWFKSTKSVEVIVGVGSSLHGSVSADASCATDTSLLLQKYDWSESEPVLFIHGYSRGDNLGGGQGTWDRFPALATGVSSPSGKALVPFEFRWRTNSDFRTAATDLGRAINFLHQHSGKKVHVVAHSFGGVVVRTLLQGLAYDIPASTTFGQMQSAIASVDSFTSVGSPYSGILDQATRITGSEFDAYLPRGRDDSIINTCGQISCAQMGEDFAGMVSYASALGFAGDDLIVGGHAALISQTTSKLPNISIHVGIGLYRKGGKVQQGDNLISFAGQRFMNYRSDEEASNTALLDGAHVSGSAATVTETILGELSTTRPGTTTASPVVGARDNGYIHSSGGAWIFQYSDGGSYWHHGLEAGVSDGCESVQSCKHDSFLLFRRAMNDLIGIGPGVTPQPMLTAQPLQVSPAVVGKLSANEVGQIQQILSQIQAGRYVSGNQVRWDLIPADTASQWEEALRRMTGLQLTPTQEAQIAQRKADRQSRLAAISEIHTQFIHDQNGWFVWDETTVLKFRDILKESVLGGYAATQFAFAEAFSVVDVASDVVDLPDGQIRNAVRLKAAFDRFYFDGLVLAGTDCRDAWVAFGSTGTPQAGTPYDMKAFSAKLFPVVKCIANALAGFSNMDRDTAKAWAKVLGASMDLGDGIKENLFTVLLDSGSAIVEWLPSTPTNTRIKAGLDFLSSSYKAYRTGVELADHNNAIFLDRIADAASLIRELEEAELQLSNQRILAVRARDLFITAPSAAVGQMNMPNGTVQANTASKWTLGSLVSTAVDVVWQFGSDVRQFFSTVSNQVSTVVDYVFQATGLQTVVATVKDATGRLLGMVTAQVDVQPGPVVTSVSPLVTTVGVVTTYVVTGSNLPEGLSFQLDGCGTVSELTAGSSDVRRQFRCTVPGSSGAGLVDGAIGPRGSNGSPFGLPLFNFKVKVLNPTVSAVTALPSPSTGARSVISVTGSDLPDTAFVLVDDASCDPATVVAKADGTGFTQSCTFGQKSGSKLVMVLSGSGPSSYVIDDTRTLTVAGAVAQPTTLFDDFTGVAVDSTLWNIDGWNGTGNKYDNWTGPRVGTVAVANGFVQFGQVGRISTKGKATFSGSAPIVIEGRMASSSTLHSTNVMLVDTASGDQILMGDTNYANFGFYALGIGSYKLTDAFLPGDTSNPLALGSSTTAFMEYRLTLNGVQIKIERGPTLDNITQTGTATLGRSIVGRTFHLSIGSDWAYFPATFDWVKVRSPVTLFGTTSRPTQVADTGVTTCTDYAFSPYSLEHSSGLDCALSQDSRGDPIPARQDGATGRDALAAKGQLVKVGTGPGGFDFTKLDESGVELPPSATSWACVRDNHTKLVWENKTSDGGLRDYRHRYTWYSTAADSNGGNPGHVGTTSCGGTLGSTCNTQAYVAALSAARVCGGTTWRLPKLEELISIVNYSKVSPAIDLDWFSNTEFMPLGRAPAFWSSDLYSAGPDIGVMGLEFSIGLLNTPSKSSLLATRAVMTGK